MASAPIPDLTFSHGFRSYCLFMSPFPNPVEKAALSLGPSSAAIILSLLHPLTVLKIIRTEAVKSRTLRRSHGLGSRVTLSQPKTYIAK